MPIARPSLLLIFLLLLSDIPPSHSLPFSSYISIISLSHSVASRVATLRAARDDYEGAVRARNFARILEPGLGLGFYKFAWTVGWDYMKNYAWRSTASFGTIAGLASDMNELLRSLGKLNSLQTNAERVAWVSQNYGNALRSSKSIFTRLLAICRQSGPLRDLVEALQKEVVEGDLLRDCLELGADDIKGLIRVLTDIARQDAPRAEL